MAKRPLEGPSFFNPSLTEIKMNPHDPDPDGQLVDPMSRKFSATHLEPLDHFEHVKAGHRCLLNLAFSSFLDLLLFHLWVNFLQIWGFSVLNPESNICPHERIAFTIYFHPQDWTKSKFIHSHLGTKLEMRTRKLFFLAKCSLTSGSSPKETLWNLSAGYPSSGHVVFYGSLLEAERSLKKWLLGSQMTS